MTSLNDVYRKFGEVSEAAQLLETELGNLLLISKATDENLFEAADSEKAEKILKHVNKSTLGQLLSQLRGNQNGLEDLDDLLAKAKAERNWLIHTFYRQHNFRCNTDNGCAFMLEDLEQIHQTLLAAYKEVMKLTGVDLDKLQMDALPTSHLPL